MQYTVDEIKNRITNNKQQLMQDFSVKNLFLFGSYAKGLQTDDSDIDILVEFSDDVDMFKMVDLQDFLKNLFGKNVDLGTPNGLKSFIKASIMNEAILL